MFLYASINAHKSWASILEKLHHYQRTKTWWTWRVISIIAENKWHAFHKTHFVYNESLQHPTIKFCSLRFFFFALEYSLVPKKSTLSIDRIPTLTRPGKARHFSHQSFLSCFHKTYIALWKCLYVVSHVAILPSFHGLSWKRLGPWLPIWSAHAKKKSLPLWVVRDSLWSRSYNRRQNELSHFSLKGLLDVFLTSKGEYIAFPPPFPSCNVVPLFELPIETIIIHPNFQWRGQGRGVDSFVLWSYPVWVATILSPIVGLCCLASNWNN